jgi:hypothetical protein
MNQQITLLFTVYRSAEQRQYFASGRVAQTLYALVEAGERGITALEVNSWAYRLASYIYDLRHDYGLDIQTKAEPHEGGTHARYVLVTPVEVEEVGN